MEELSKKSYTKAEVEKLLFEIKYNYDSILKEQKDRIFILINENKEIKAADAKLKQRDTLISSALKNAVVKAKELENATKIKTEIEINRLKNFQIKCEEYLNNISKTYPIDTTIKKFDEFNKSMKRILCVDESKCMEISNEKFRNLNKLSFISEETSATKNFNPKEKIEKYIESENSFNIDDVLNPKKELNLEQLCKDLGLMD